MLSLVARQVMRILGWQLASLIVLSAVAAWCWDGRVGRSVGIGGGIGLIATSYLAFVTIKHSLHPARPATVLSLFGNWFVKTALALGLLAVALRSAALAPAAVLFGLAGSMLAYWLAMMTGRYRVLKMGTRLGE
jgi:F0F1-type ATP synthase assembly protein I